jgi:sugar transferase (PEP-CTERM system associated)
MFLIIAMESTLIGLALFSATLIRIRISGASIALTSLQSLERLVVVVVVCELALYYYDLYDFQVVSRRTVLFINLVRALGVSCVILGVIYYLQPRLSLGRGVASLAAPVIVIVILGWRLLLDAGAPLLRRGDRLLMLGTGSAGTELLREIQTRTEFGLTVVGFLNDRPGATLPDEVKIIGDASELEEVVARQNVDRVIISLAERRGRMPVRELLHLKFAGVQIQEVHSLFETISGRILLEHVAPSWFILSEGFRKSRAMLGAKRALDISVALIALLVTAPIMAVTALLIVIEDGRPILFRQRRVGMKGREFQMLKFRSMYKDSERHGAKWATDTDSRVTRIGRIIRTYRIDELPQMINVLLGDMSLIGPRPEQPMFVRQLEETIPYYGLRHSVRPGITGWAQVRFRYAASIEDSKVKLEYDLFYIKHLSMVLDLAIMFETFKVLLSGRGAK